MGYEGQKFMNANFLLRERIVTLPESPLVTLLATAISKQQTLWWIFIAKVLGIRYEDYYYDYIAH